MIPQKLAFHTTTLAEVIENESLPIRGRLTMKNPHMGMRYTKIFACVASVRLGWADDLDEIRLKIRLAEAW